MQSCDENQNKMFVCTAECSALKALLKAISENNKVCGASKAALVYAMRMRSLAKKVAKVFESDPAVLATICTFIVERVEKAVSCAAKLEAVLNQLPPPPPGLDNLQSKTHNGSRKYTEETSKVSRHSAKAPLGWLRVSKVPWSNDVDLARTVSVKESCHR